MPRPPDKPGYFDKVNYVIDSWTIACEAPWYIYIETLWPAALEAFITLATFGWDDVLRGYWRPKGARAFKHGRKGKKSKPKKFYFPEIGEEIGKKLPGATAVKGRKWGAAGQYLWAIDSAAQRLLFYWLVVDVAIDFAFNWTSLLYETEWCKQSHLGKFSYRKNGWSLAIDSHWISIGYATLDYQNGPPSWFLTGGNTGPVSANVAGAIVFKPVTGGETPIGSQLRLISSTTGKVFNTGTASEPDSDGRVTVATFGKIPPGHGFNIQYKIFVPVAQHGEGVVVGIEVED